MRSEIKIYTSYVNKDNMRKVVESNLLPIFILRKIYNSNLIGRYTDTVIHMKKLAPSELLYRDKRDGNITNEEFAKRYIIELSQEVNFQDLINNLEALKEVSGASGIVFMSYGEDYEHCHRKILSGILNTSGLLENEIIELN